MKYLMSILTFLLFLPLAIAQEVMPSATPAVLGALDKIDAMVPGDLSAWVIGGIAVAAELLMRFWPTLKPKSFFLVAAAILNKAGAILQKLGTLGNRIADGMKQ